MVPVDRRSASSTDSPARAREWRMRGEEEKRASQPTAMEERMVNERRRRKKEKEREREREAITQF